jgi:proteasome lid subunit RPN8/RPN11
MNDETDLPRAMPIAIIRRHLDKIIGHCIDKYPSEAGGFIGGRGDLILGIFPVPNFELWFHRDKRAFFWDDFSKSQAESLFKRYHMDIIGLYHSHPNGIALPSHGDFAAHKEYGLKIALIAGVLDRKLTEIAAFSLPQKEDDTFKHPQDEFVPEHLEIVEDADLDGYIAEKQIQTEIRKSADQYLAQEQALEKRVAQILSKQSND